MAGVVNRAYTLEVNVQEAGAPEQSVNVRAWNAADTSVLDKTTDVDGDVPRVYLICDRKDESAVEAIEDYLYGNGIEVSLPDFEADEATVSQIHWQNLEDCDAALVYYGAGGKSWVDIKLRDLLKAAGYRGGHVPRPQ